MRFFREHARDPISASLVAAGIFVLLFIGFELARGLHRYHSAYMETSLEKQAPAGLLKATLSLGQMELAGWAPQQTSVQIFDHDKLLVTAPVSIEGKWTASFAFDRHKGVQILNAVDTDKDKTSDMGKIGIFMPEKSGDNAFVWWDGPVIDRLLASPAQGEEGDIALALAWTHGDRGIALAGRAAAGSLVQVYADDEYVGSAPAGDDGAWIVPTILTTDRKTAALRFDEIQGQDVAERRNYRLNWTDSKDSWSIDWPVEGAKKEVIAILKPDAGEISAPDEEKPGQVIPSSSKSSLH